MTKKKSFLWTLNILNLLCLIFAFKHNTGNYGDKWSLSPFHSLWEFFTIWWCVGCSILLFFYTFREIKINNSKNQLIKKKSGRWLGLIMASTCFTSILGFTLACIEKMISKDGWTKLLKSPFSWGIYSFTGHYLVFPLALIYFFKYEEEENFSKRKILYLVIPFPIIYFLVNIIRLSWIDNYFNDKLILRSRVFWFDSLKEGRYGRLLAGIAFSIFYFWTVSYSLLKFKKGLWGRPMTILSKTKKLKQNEKNELKEFW